MQPSDQHPAADFRDHGLDAVLTAHGYEPLTVLDTVESTNAWLAQRAATDGGGLRAVVTGHQSAGRGRLDRSWHTPPGMALTFSVACTPQATDGTVLPMRYWPWLSLVMAHSVTRAVRRLAGLPAVVKWPNDVLLEERKICGVLATVVTSGATPAVVVGAGLNVNQPELPVDTATSLRVALGPGATVPTRPELLEAVLGEYARCLTLLGEDPDQAMGPGGPLRDVLEDEVDTLGRRVDVHLPGQDRPTRALATGLGPSGELQVTTEAGATMSLSAGEVVHVRAARPGEVTPAARRAREDVAAPGQRP